VAKIIERPIPYLAFPRVDDAVWLKLQPGQRDLHLLWTKKLLPLYTDEERVRSEDLGPGDRESILQLLSAISARRLTLKGPESFRTASGEGCFLHGRTDLRGEKATLEVIVLKPDDGSSEADRISIHAHAIDSEIDIVILWRAQEDPGRGSVLLYPQAAHSRRRFGIAAFNRPQFRAIADAFVEYCRDCRREGKSQEP